MTQIDRVVEVVEETLKGNVTQLLKKKPLPRLDLPKVLFQSLHDSSRTALHTMSL